MPLNPFDVSQGVWLQVDEPRQVLSTAGRTRMAHRDVRGELIPATRATETLNGCLYCRYTEREPEARRLTSCVEHRIFGTATTTMKDSGRGENFALFIVVTAAPVSHRLDNTTAKRTISESRRLLLAHLITKTIRYASPILMGQFQYRRPGVPWASFLLYGIQQCLIAAPEPPVLCYADSNERCPTS